MNNTHQYKTMNDIKETKQLNLMDTFLSKSEEEMKKKVEKCLTTLDRALDRLKEVKNNEET